MQPVIVGRVVCLTLTNKGSRPQYAGRLERVVRLKSLPFKVEIQFHGILGKVGWYPNDRLERCVDHI